jgi:hypothetical protein
MEIKQRLYKRRLDVKMAWSKSQKKQLQDNYKECTDTSYGRAVALTKINTKKLKQNTEKKITINKKCKCSSETHQRITHKDYPENPKKNLKKTLQGILHSLPVVMVVLRCMRKTQSQYHQRHELEPTTILESTTYLKTLYLVLFPNAYHT